MFLRALSRSLARRPARFGVAVLAVAMGVGMAVALASVSLVLGDRLGRTVRAYGANLVLTPRGSEAPVEIAGTDVSASLDAGALPESSLAVLKAFRWRNNVLGYAPQSYAAGSVENPSVVSTRAAARVAVVGTWFRRELKDSQGAPYRAGMTTIAPWWRVTGRYPAEAAEAAEPVGGPEPSASPAAAAPTAAAPATSTEALVGRALATRLGVGPGDDLRVRLESDAAGAAREIRVSGVLDAGGFEDAQLFVPAEWLATATGRAGEVKKALVSVLVIPGEAPPMPDPGKDLEGFERWSCRPYAATVANEIEGAAPGVSAHPVAQLVRAEGRLVGRLNLLMLLLTGAALTAAALGVMSTMFASVVDRTSEIALLRALGATGQAVARLFLAEALVVAVAGGALGVAVGYGLAQLVGRDAFGAAVEPRPVLAAAGIALSLAVCVAGSWWPIRRVAAVDPAQTLRPGA